MNSESITYVFKLTSNPSQTSILNVDKMKNLYFVTISIKFSPKNGMLWYRQALILPLKIGGSGELWFLLNYRWHFITFIWGTLLSFQVSSLNTFLPFCRFTIYKIFVQKSKQMSLKYVAISIICDVSLSMLKVNGYVW